MLNEQTVEGCQMTMQTGNKLVVQHADSTISVMTFDRVEKLTTLQAAKEVAEMQFDPEAQGKFYYFVIRDLYNKQILVAKPDGCYRYSVVKYCEAPEKDVLKAIQEAATPEEDTQERVKATVFNSKYPILTYWDGARTEGAAVKIPATRFFYRNDILRINLPITLPPLVYALTVYKASYAPQSSHVCVLAKDAAVVDEVSLAYLPMPNVFSHDCSICVGTVHRTGGVPPRSLTEAISISFDMFINSTWNTDLVNQALYPSNLRTVYEEVGGDKKMEELGIATHDSYTEHRKLITVLAQEDGWKKLQWQTQTLGSEQKESFGL